MGTQHTLIVVGDSISTTDRVEGLVAEDHHFAFLICRVGIPAAVHLWKEHRAKR